MNIVLFYEHITREGDEIKSIAAYLRNSGCKVKIYSIGFQYGEAILYSKLNKIDVLVMPWMHHDLNYELLYPFIRNNPSIRIIDLHHEEIASDHTINILLPHGDYATHEIYHFVWGEYFKDKLIKMRGVSPEKIFVTGNGRTDFIKKNRLNREQIAKKYNLDLKKKWVLFAENRGWAITWTEKMTEERTAHGVSREETEEYVRLTKASLDASLEDMNSLSDGFYSEYELIYRPHPGTIPQEGLNSKIKVISDYTIYHWLSVIDINVVWSSTTIFESDAMNVPSFVYEPIEDNDHFKTYGIHEYKCITSIEEISRETVKEALATQKSNRTFITYLGTIDGKRCENIASSILALGRAKSNKGPRPLKISYARKAKLVMYGFVTRVFARFNLIKLLKYPKSAYLEYNDIPWIYGKDLK